MPVRETVDNDNLGSRAINFAFIMMVRIDLLALKWSILRSTYEDVVDSVESIDFWKETMSDIRCFIELSNEEYDQLIRNFKSQSKDSSFDEVGYKLVKKKWLIKKEHIFSYNKELQEVSKNGKQDILKQLLSGLFTEGLKFTQQEYEQYMNECIAKNEFIWPHAVFG